MRKRGSISASCRVPLLTNWNVRLACVPALMLTCPMPPATEFCFGSWGVYPSDPATISKST